MINDLCSYQVYNEKYNIDKMIYIYIPNSTGGINTTSNNH